MQPKLLPLHPLLHQEFHNDYLSAAFPAQWALPGLVGGERCLPSPSLSWTAATSPSSPHRPIYLLLRYCLLRILQQRSESCSFISHHFSSYLIVSHRFSSFLIISHKFSSFPIVSHRLSSFLIISHPFSSFLILSHSFSSFSIVSHSFSLLLIVYHT